MPFEYKVVPAPRRGEKARGVKTTGDRFAHAMTNLMNSLALEGWEYLRADTLPVDERQGLTGTKTTYQNLLIFRRALQSAEAAVEPAAFVSLRAPSAAAPEAPAIVRLGSATVPAEGQAPSLGPARDIAAE